ncbi:MAG TPA: hypothetical protein VKV29_05875 [Chthonomonas sp.]|jgi:hypothetical protein|uniref:Yip1 family protein n=1 Tax=Chthonomonas sp. TaxID=2282153 RepID=UPI002B4B2133|nr:hypothetical protein [Chthonomonas sp.]HLH79796.1 hypothetical protein [Chthonomonas sp.]
MICKHCGMESTTTDRCSVCGLPLQSAQETAEQTTTEVTKESEPEVDSTAAPSPKKEVIKAHRPAPAIVPPTKKHSGPAFGAAKHTPPPAVPPPSRRVASLSEILESKSTTDNTPAPAYSNKAPDPLASVLANLKLPQKEATETQSTPSDDNTLTSTETAPPAASLAPSQPAASVQSAPATAPQQEPSQPKQPTPRPTAAEELEAYAPPNPWPITARYAAVLALLLAFAGLFPLYQKNLFWAPMLLTQFLGGLLLPVMRVVPWFDEDPDDLPLAIGLIFFFGPLIGLVIYSIISLLRHNTNPGLVGCLIVGSLSLLVVQPAWLGHLDVQWLAPFAGVQTNPLLLIAHLAMGWSPIVVIVGWIFAGVFHKLYE